MGPALWILALVLEDAWFSACAYRAQRQRSAELSQIENTGRLEIEESVRAVNVVEHGVIEEWERYSSLLGADKECLV